MKIEKYFNRKADHLTRKSEGVSLGSFVVDVRRDDRVSEHVLVVAVDVGVDEEVAEELSHLEKTSEDWSELHDEGNFF